MPAKQKSDATRHRIRSVLSKTYSRLLVGYVTEDLYRTFMAMSWRTLSTKRVAAAVGEGSAAVRSVHEYHQRERGQRGEPNFRSSLVQRRRWRASVPVRRKCDQIQ
jgi:hypothetical protein